MLRNEAKTKHTLNFFPVGLGNSYIVNVFAFVHLFLFIIDAFLSIINVIDINNNKGGYIM